MESDVEECEPSWNFEPGITATSSLCPSIATFGCRRFSAEPLWPSLIFAPQPLAVTYKVLDITFHKAAQMGDQIFLEAEIVELGNNSIVVQVEAYRQPRDQKFPERIHAATAKLVFVTLQGDKYFPHRLKLS